MQCFDNINMSGPLVLAFFFHKHQDLMTNYEIIISSFQKFTEDRRDFSHFTLI